MSIIHAVAVMDCQAVKGTPKAVLSNLAIRADENDKCWPGREKIADDVGISIRAVTNALKTLSDLGLIDIERKQYGQVFTLQMRRICTSEPVSDVQDIPSDVQDIPSDVQIMSSDVQDIPPNIQEETINKQKKVQSAHPPDLEPLTLQWANEADIQDCIKRNRTLFRTLQTSLKITTTLRSRFPEFLKAHPQAKPEDVVFWIEREWPKHNFYDGNKPPIGTLINDFTMPASEEDIQDYAILENYYSGKKKNGMPSHLRYAVKFSPVQTPVPENKLDWAVTETMRYRPPQGVPAHD